MPCASWPSSAPHKAASKAPHEPQNTASRNASAACPDLAPAARACRHAPPRRPLAARSRRHPHRTAPEPHLKDASWPARSKRPSSSPNSKPPRAPTPPPPLLTPCSSATLHSASNTTTKTATSSAPPWATAAPSSAPVISKSTSASSWLAAARRATPPPGAGCCWPAHLQRPPRRARWSNTPPSPTR
ncbi:hypothetical protein ADJ79_07170 [Ottowia sp. oral taxon 894]|nr:hypothetical protein ADJ79_07170 [Ottowia sp. oral taxon 894]